MRSFCKFCMYVCMCKCFFLGGGKGEGEEGVCEGGDST